MLKKLRFIEELDKMKYIKRAPYLCDWTLEDDTQHSWHLAMMVMMFVPENLDLEKCLKIALYHDLPEIYAWDCHIHDDKLRASKKGKEAISIKKLSLIMPEDKKEEILWIIDDYDNKKTKEARFVAELDKIQPLMMEVIEWWSTLKEHKADYDKIYNFTRKGVTDEFWLWKIAEYYLEEGKKKDIFYRENK